MGCNCNNRCNGMLATMQTGGTFMVQLKVKNGNTVSQLSEGQGILVGFYDNRKNLILSCSTNDGRITYVEGVYSLTVSHEESMAMEKAVFVEVTLTDGESVLHGDKVVALDFENRENNKILKKNGST